MLVAAADGRMVQREGADRKRAPAHEPQNRTARRPGLDRQPSAAIATKLLAAPLGRPGAASLRAACRHARRP
jgi:hypothetical protein